MQFIPIDPNVEVNGRTIMAFVTAMPAFQSTFESILSESGLVNLQPDDWYPQSKWLNAFEKVGKKLGSNTLFTIGKAIPENAEFPPQINNLRSALESINMAYQMNHRFGEIGYYKLIAFNDDLRTAIMECMNPYPSDFDRGIITTMVRKFKPISSLVITVELDHNKPTRLNGSDSCTYRISW
ncbi:MAG: hypothetical protein RIS47_1864 [Bacteroidota bacterium]|jgi:hypothetical protein